MRLGRHGGTRFSVPVYKNVDQMKYPPGNRIYVMSRARVGTNATGAYRVWHQNLLPGKIIPERHMHSSRGIGFVSTLHSKTQVAPYDRAR